RRGDTPGVTVFCRYGSPTLCSLRLGGLQLVTSASLVLWTSVVARLWQHSAKASPLCSATCDGCALWSCNRIAIAHLRKVHPWRRSSRRGVSAARCSTERSSWQSKGL